MGNGRPAREDRLPSGAFPNAREGRALGRPGEACIIQDVPSA
jgi:hypothetical protein